jgi:hypothetical protein
MRFSVSHIRVVFIFLSNALEELRLGDMFISNKWGLKF